MRTKRHVTYDWKRRAWRDAKGFYWIRLIVGWERMARDEVDHFRTCHAIPWKGTTPVTYAKRA